MKYFWLVGALALLAVSIYMFHVGYTTSGALLILFSILYVGLAFYHRD